MPKPTKNSKNSRSDLRSNILYLGIVSLLNDIASEMITPLLPIFLTSVLGAPGVAVGFIEGLGKAAEQLFSVFAGWYSDRIGKRKPIVIAGYLLSNLMKGVFAFTTSWFQFMFVRFMERSGKAVRTPPRDAILAQSVVGDRRSGFALHRILDAGGAIVGPIIAIVLLAQLDNNLNDTVRSLFLISLIPGLLAVAIIVLFVKEPPMAVKKEKRKYGGFYEIFNLKKYGLRFNQLLLSFVFLFLFAPTIAFFYLKASAIGFDLSGVLLLAILFSISYIFGAGSLTIFSRWRKVNERQGILLGLCGFIAVYLLTSGVAAFEHFIVLFALYGFFTGMLEVEVKSYIASLVKKEELASAYGAYQTSTGFAMIAGGVIFGLLWDLSKVFAFQAAAIGSLIALLLFLSNKFEQKNK